MRLPGRAVRSTGPLAGLPPRPALPALPTIPALAALAAAPPRGFVPEHQPDADGVSPFDAIPAPPPTDAWAPDVLGSGHEARTLPLADDFEGEVVATLVRYRAELDPAAPEGATDAEPRYAVVYLHGWSDYLLNPEIGPFWAGVGGVFYAVDLRKYGRSLRRYQTPGYIDDLATYDEDIEAALDVVEEEHPGLPVVLMAHSTGGLTASLWADRFPGRAAALVLVAPWLETQGSTLVRSVSTPVVTEVAKAFPLRVMPNVDLGFYNRTISDAHDGEWPIVGVWRPEHSFPVRYGWLAAILRGHGRVAQGLAVDVPVLVVRSARTLISPMWDDAMASSDIVIDVDVVAQRALRIAPTVTVATVEGALHDVLLSRPAVRARAYAEIAHWGRAYLP
ncbi:MAG TPA: alpha/beta hydrolase [Micrococcales bacterium]|uniref:alpha/beta hydrolase n=1 Tax=Miniimonas TaxID=947525 RepID=UPI000D529311|nr:MULTISPECIES: alpha/beta hydrolase [Miniimonas]HCX85554.1 alpha/beta hydrolase [Micrococcales bacterium]